MTARLRIGVIVVPLAALVSLATALPPASASAAPTPIPNRFCHPVRVHHQSWGVDGRGAHCSFMRRWTRRFLETGAHPRRWTCVNLGEGGDCRKRHSSPFFEFYLFD